MGNMRLRCVANDVVFVVAFMFSVHVRALCQLSSSFYSLGQRV